MKKLLPLAVTLASMAACSLLSCSQGDEPQPATLDPVDTSMQGCMMDKKWHRFSGVYVDSGGYHFLDYAGGVLTDGEDDYWMWKSDMSYVFHVNNTPLGFDTIAYGTWTYDTATFKMYPHYPENLGTELIISVDNDSLKTWQLDVPGTPLLNYDTLWTTYARLP